MLKFAIFTLALLIVISTLAIVFLKIKNIQLNNQDCVSHDELFEKYFKDKKILFLNLKSHEEQIYHDYSCVSKINIKKIYPTKLEINISPKELIAKVASSDLYLTSDGELVKSQNQNLLIPTFYPPEGVVLKEHEKASDNLTKFAVDICTKLTKSDYQFSSLRIVDRNQVVVYSTGESIAIFSPNKDANFQIDSLQAILAQAKIDASKIQKIDLRFDKALIVYK